MTVLQLGLQTLAYLIVAPLVVLLVIYILEISIGLVRRNRRSSSVQTGSGDHASGVVLIPAHNEATVIAENIRILKDQLPDNVDILVVADNCTDQTAAQAAQAGARVIERQDPSQRGKGYALAFGRDELAKEPPAYVIILDADCRLAPGSVEALSSACLENRVPVQATNLIYSTGTAPPMVQISNFAMLIKNLVRQRGMTQMGGAALLTGTGMAFPWSIFATAPLASADLAEDLALGVSLSRQGKVPLFLESAGVSSEAAAEEDTLVQRTRWEHGFLSTARQFALPLIADGLRRGSRGIFFLGLHLLVPPLALLFGLGFLALLVSVLLLATGITPLPALILLCILGLAVLVTIMAWFVEGRSVLSVAALFRIPAYVLWKVPVYLKLVSKRETQWIRTRRAGEDRKDGADGDL